MFFVVCDLFISYICIVFLSMPKETAPIKSCHMCVIELRDFRKLMKYEM